ncbi:hypothetical protein OsI_32686 [Oryza sativa Indica Group]|uniref:Gnk2-homologous domain-containing protein n=1 Tax=Oryza sativa subsp. indica TaxID=39946 RepID=A2Z4W1_ORYSI|nr:hypothetical protein OsI_32686 [Oryza sativa Indica Group]
MVAACSATTSGSCPQPSRTKPPPPCTTTPPPPPGQAPDVVYVLALCRGDLDDTACGKSVANTFTKLINESCDANYTAGAYYGDCAGVNSSHNFLEPSNDGDEMLLDKWNVNNITGDGENVRFIAGLIQQLLSETVETAAGAAGRFATGVVDTGRTFPLVYSLAQCTPDLSAGDCLACLRRLTGMINSTMAVRMGAQIHVTRCYFRYEAYVFYDSKPMLHLTGATAPPPAPAIPKIKNMQQYILPGHKMETMPIHVGRWALVSRPCYCVNVYCEGVDRGNTFLRDLFACLWHSSKLVCTIAIIVR